MNSSGNGHAPNIGIAVTPALSLHDNDTSPALFCRVS